MGLPFSFVYSGRPVSQLVDRWKAVVGRRDAGGGKELRILTLTDPETGLEVRAVATIYTDTPGVDWTLDFTNRGKADTPILEQVRAVDVTCQGERRGYLHRLTGSSSADDDWLPLADALPPANGSNSPRPAAGQSSSGACPFFNLQWAGGGVITAIGWSAQWSAAVERAGGDLLRLQAGMQTMRLKLRPGETIRSPRIMQLDWFGDDPWWATISFADDVRPRDAPRRRPTGRRRRSPT